jgi:hypothetical protein
MIQDLNNKILEIDRKNALNIAEIEGKSKEIVQLKKDLKEKNLEITKLV